MDVVMPGLNGFQATRQLGRDPLTAAIPVVILTTKSQDADRIWGVRQGARGYLTKPVDERLLVDTIRQVLAAPGG
jgi:twitching motility two-component system response regulator PilH